MPGGIDEPPDIVFGGREVEPAAQLAIKRLDTGADSVEPQGSHKAQLCLGERMHVAFERQLWGVENEPRPNEFTQLRQLAVWNHRRRTTAKIDVVESQAPHEGQRRQRAQLGFQHLDVVHDRIVGAELVLMNRTKAAERLAKRQVQVQLRTRTTHRWDAQQLAKPLRRYGIQGRRI